MTNSTGQKTYALFQTPNNKKIISEFINKDVNYFVFPPLETHKTTVNREIIALLKNIIQFDWLIFTDVHAVDYFLEILADNELDFFELDAVRVCAFGEIVADRLRFAQIHADLIPNEINSEIIFSAIGFYVGVKHLKNLKMLLIKEDTADFGIVNLLIEAQAEMIEVPIYTAKTSDKSAITKLKTLLKGGAIDEFIFSAPEDLIALYHYFPNENELKTIFEDVKASAIDANIFQNLRENGIKAHYFIVR